MTKVIFGSLTKKKATHDKGCFEDHFNHRLSLRLDPVLQLGFLGVNVLLLYFFPIRKIFSEKYLHKMVVVDGAFINNPVQVREVSEIFYFSLITKIILSNALIKRDIFVKQPVQVNVVGIAPSHKIVLCPLKI